MKMLSSTMRMRKSFLVASTATRAGVFKKVQVAPRAFSTNAGFGRERIHQEEETERNCRLQAPRLGAAFSLSPASTATTARHQRRWLHHTPHRSFAPFLPEIIVGVGLGAGWVVYRKSQGKPLTPDEAVASQAAYRKWEQEVQRRNAKYNTATKQQHENDHQRRDELHA